VAVGIREQGDGRVEFDFHNKEGGSGDMGGVSLLPLHQMQQNLARVRLSINYIK
jgi:hypothetical protein